METLTVDEPMSAWNIDGSSDAVAGCGSWLAFAEHATGRKRGTCSFAGCTNRAEVGGHVWIAQEGPCIAPICRPCNHPGNELRMQRGGSRLKKGVEVTRTGVSEGMRSAERRAPTERGKRRRRCTACGDDISERPGSHTRCYPCWRGDGGRGARSCAACGDRFAPSKTFHRLCDDCA